MLFVIVMYSILMSLNDVYVNFYQMTIKDSQIFSTVYAFRR